MKAQGSALGKMLSKILRRVPRALPWAFLFDAFGVVWLRIPRFIGRTSHSFPAIFKILDSGGEERLAYWASQLFLTSNRRPFHS